MIIILEKKMKIKVDWNGKDDNNGFIYGIEYQDENENVIDIEWFKTEEERNKSFE